MLCFCRRSTDQTQGKETGDGRDEKDSCIVETVRTVKYRGHRLGHLPEAYKGVKDLFLAPFFFGVGSYFFGCFHYL